MKRFIIFLLVCFFTVPAAAQHQLLRGSRAVKNAEKVIQSSSRASDAVSKIYQSVERAALPVGQPAFQGTAVLPPAERNIESATKELFYPANRLLMQHFTMWPTPTEYLGSVFQARPSKKAGENMFSGTVFKTLYNGKEEIYGVIAAHTIADHIGDPSLERVFIADIFSDGKFISVPAEVVQVSAPSTLDLALVKFPTDVEDLLHPLVISQEEPLLGDLLQTQGFHINYPLYLPDRSLLSKNTLYLRAEIELTPQQRRGLCGSNVLNKQGELVGVHIGSNKKKNDSNYVGFATRAAFLPVLVEAYHNNGRAQVPFVFDGKKILDLNVDEYISYVRLVAQDGSVIWYEMLLSKFPYREMEELVKTFSPRYMEFVVSRLNWNGEMLVEEHGLINPANSTRYRYDFRTKQLGLY